MKTTQTTQQAIDAERKWRGQPPATTRHALIHLAIRAGYTCPQISEQLRSGRGDERPDLPGGDDRIALNARKES